MYLFFIYLSGGGEERVGGGEEGENLQADSPLSMKQDTGLNLKIYGVMTWDKTKRLGVPGWLSH